MNPGASRRCQGQRPKPQADRNLREPPDGRDWRLEPNPVVPTGFRYEILNVSCPGGSRQPCLAPGRAPRPPTDCTSRPARPSSPSTGATTTWGPTAPRESEEVQRPSP